MAIRVPGELGSRWALGETAGGQCVRPARLRRLGYTSFGRAAPGGRLRLFGDESWGSALSKKGPETRRVQVARYRLRFVLQEFDLPRGATIVGRSLECHLTIDDPLVSRIHARITVGDDGACIEDMGSRNGVRVNGSPIRGLTALRSGDRARIGTQELIFTCVEDAVPAFARITG